jgi:hypothetical protein
MKPSTSTTSLTALSEKGCIICSKSDEETGEVLIESKVLTNCACVFRAHRTCWEMNVMETDEKLCPSCNKTVIPSFMLYPAISIERGHGNPIMSPSNWHMVYCIFVLIIITVIIIAGFQFNWFMKAN